MCVCMCVWLAGVSGNRSATNKHAYTHVNVHKRWQWQRVQDSIVAQAVEVAVTYTRPMQVHVDRSIIRKGCVYVCARVLSKGVACMYFMSVCVYI